MVLDEKLHKLKRVLGQFTWNFQD